jgi:hypothetical protein
LLMKKSPFYSLWVTRLKNKLRLFTSLKNPRLWRGFFCAKILRSFLVSAKHT